MKLDSNIDTVENKINLIIQKLTEYNIVFNEEGMRYFLNLNKEILNFESDYILDFNIVRGNDLDEGNSEYTYFDNNTDYLGKSLYKKIPINSIVSLLCNSKILERLPKEQPIKIASEYLCLDHDGDYGVIAFKINPNMQIDICAISTYCVPIKKDSLWIFGSQK